MISFITFPDGKRVQITHVINVILNNTITLHDLLYVPEFHFNLISVKRLSKDLGCQLHDKLYAQDRRGNLECFSVVFNMDFIIL